MAAYNVKFLKGTQEAYESMAVKDANTFYYTGTNLYLGDIKLSNANDINAALTKIAEIEGSIDSIEDAIGNLSSLNTTAKNDLVSAINEVLAAIDVGGTGSLVTLEESNSEDYAKVYTIKQGGNAVGTINIPKDMVVQSGTVEVNPEGQELGTYIVLTLANATSDKIYINVASLVDIYTAQENATQIQLTINSTTREISANLVSGSVTSTILADNAVTTAKIANDNITLDKLSTEIKNSLTKAENSIQSIATGTINGTISVDGEDIPVKGLGSAAFTSSTDYDPAGSADAIIGSEEDTSNMNTIYGVKSYAKDLQQSLQENLKGYIDAALTWGTF